MGQLYDVAPFKGFHPEIGILLSSLEDSTREWRENLGELPGEAIIWQPAPKGHSVGALILHMIDCESYWFEAFAAGKERDPEEVKLWMSEETGQFDAEWPVPPSAPLAWYYAEQDRIRARSLEALRGLDPERRYQRKGEEFTLRWIVAHILEHDSYTGGQAVLLHEQWKKAQTSG